MSAASSSPSSLLPSSYLQFPLLIKLLVLLLLVSVIFVSICPVVYCNMFISSFIWAPFQYISFRHHHRLIRLSPGAITPSSQATSATTTTPQRNYCGGDKSRWSDDRIPTRWPPEEPRMNQWDLWCEGNSPLSLRGYWWFNDLMIMWTADQWSLITMTTMMRVSMPLADRWRSMIYFNFAPDRIHIMEYHTKFHTIVLAE